MTKIGQNTGISKKGKKVQKMEIMITLTVESLNGKEDDENEMHIIWSQENIFRQSLKTVVDRATDLQ